MVRIAETLFGLVVIFPLYFAFRKLEIISQPFRCKERVIGTIRIR